MKPSNLTVRCMARRENGLWVAVCIDFSLAVQADTLGQAKEKLHAQIASYVREALTVDAEHAEELLARRAPLWDRLVFAWFKLMMRLREQPRKGAAYCDALPMKPALA